MARSVGPDPELDRLARLAGTLSGGPVSLTVGVAPSGSIPLRGGDGEVRGGLLVAVPVDGVQRAALDQLAAHAGALLERRERESGLLDAVGALLRTYDELAAFAGRVAHDLRAPLTALLGFLTLADGPLRAEPAECVRSALGAATRMRALVDDLLAYATCTARLALGPVDLPAVVTALIADLGAGGRVRYVGAERVRSDATLVRQLVRNLVGNALSTRARPHASRWARGWRPRPGGCGSPTTGPGSPPTSASACSTRSSGWGAPAAAGWAWPSARASPRRSAARSPSGRPTAGARRSRPPITAT
jgi:His Kinase A (phospho-acceptor) domain